MDSEQVERHIKEILFGKAIADITNSEGQEETYLIRSLTGRENVLVTYIHEKELTDGKRQGLCTQEELKELYLKSGTWTKEDDDKMESLSVGIKRLNNMIPDFQYRRNRLRQIKKRIQTAQEELNELQTAHHKLFVNCLEYRAQEVKFRKIAFYCLETIDEQPFWTAEEFNNFTDFIFVNNVVEAYLRTFILKECDIRAIARSPQWRYRWNGAKNGADLFGKAAAEWSEAQNALIYWSLYYDNVFMQPELPSHIVDDDAALDAWIEKESKKREKDVLNSRKSTAFSKKHGGNGLQEVFVFTDREDKESIEKIQGLNDPITRAGLRQERKVLEEKGEVREWELRKGKFIKRDE